MISYLRVCSVHPPTTFEQFNFCCMFSHAIFLIMLSGVVQTTASRVCVFTRGR
jgi:hypothetical protein